MFRNALLIYAQVRPTGPVIRELCRLLGICT